ncbi:hypothetical protein K501DRAFT_58503 [Backusella circina FSU 941]|nr:hypothetical protein K501DRAFT_58503 [Backusella circina FSU 941]
MKSHTRVSGKGYLKRFKSLNDYYKTVDEYASNVTYSNCFRQLRREVLRRNEKIVRVSGALQ